MNWNDLEDIIKSKKVLIPLLFILGATSRMTYDYLLKDKVPTKKQVAAQLILGTFVMVTTYFFLVGEVPQNKLTGIVLTMGFFNHSALTLVLENKEKIVSFLTKKKQ